MLKIGVLDIQGSVSEHLYALQQLSKKKKFTPVLVKNPEDFKNLSGLILPGGESTAIGDLLKRFKIDKEIIKLHIRGGALYGTCAGAILLAKKIVGAEQALNLKLMNIEIKRNAYGRQIDSFETKVKFNDKKIPAIFIRAPKIVRVGKGVEILARYDKEIVAAREKNILVTMFHPELTNNLSVHEYFVSEVCKV